jgi:plastocyanin
MRIKMPLFLAIMVNLFLLQLLPGCARGPRETISVAGIENEKSVKMTAGNYYFNPVVIQASPGDVLLVEIENISGTGHNLTIENPAGEVILSIDLPAESTRAAEVRLGGPGVYPFHCDVTLHPALGMTGRIEVR